MGKNAAAIAALEALTRIGLREEAMMKALTQIALMSDVSPSEYGYQLARIKKVAMKALNWKENA